MRGSRFLARYAARVLILLLLGAGLLAAGGLALATFAPIAPGAAGYDAQRRAEQALMALTVGPAGRAAYALDLLERRANDLDAARGMPREPAAEQALSAQLEACLPYLAQAPAESAPALRARFVAVLRGLPAGALAQRVETLAARAADPAVPLDRLQSGLGLASAAAPILRPSPAATPTETSVPAITPHSVWFPPGSAGARHAFYPLQGRHAQIECAACHSQGRYAGTTRICSICHRPHTPANHYAAECDQCHTMEGWIPAHFNHLAVDTSDCQSCHTRPAGHYPGQCSACHATGGWLPATFDHQVAGANDCQSCHARPGGHFNGQCSACHATSAWLPASFNHEAAGATDCQGCHTRPGNHFAGQCSMCHSTATWAGASFNHSFPMNHGGAGGVCTRCHTSDSGGSWSCFKCHNESEMNKKHAEKDIPNYASRCLSCHPGGGKGDDD